MPVLSRQAEVEGGGKDRGKQGFPGIPEVDHPLQGVRVPTEEVTEVPDVPPYQEHQERKTDQYSQEEV